MKTIKRIPSIIQIAIQTSAAMLILSGVVSGQGSLTPPGSPVQTMKTLDQVKAGTPIASTPYNISSSGNYFLTGNLTVSSGNAVLINANGVTLDLNGFTISCTGPAGSGVLIENGRSDILICNGHIRGSFDAGITVNPGPEITGAYNTRVSGVSVNGCNKGINLYLGNSTVVESCTVWLTSTIGIVADVVTGSTASQCGGTAIYAMTASDCVGSSTSGYGIQVTAAATNCRATSGAEDGLHSEGGAVNCHGTSSNGTHAGVYAFTAQNCTGSNTVTGFGMYIERIAIGCYGSSTGGTGLRSPLAASCSATGSPAMDVTNKYDMP